MVLLEPIRVSVRDGQLECVEMSTLSILIQQILEICIWRWM